ncbi:hypothetical protein EMEDMD4_170076 [Sinorhizobium medicae]|uniref:Uncharacterized protein n=1 Tax=Sinorhizobium medicae TaxID=110321 RepID=A0A508WY01_9HYPH|nr:hypothetical protein EMEDMD4_170076 [Sinorhizobium medicae]
MRGGRHSGGGRQQMGACRFPAQSSGPRRRRHLLSHRIRTHRHRPATGLELAVPPPQGLTTESHVKLTVEANEMSRPAGHFSGKK